MRILAVIALAGLCGCAVQQAGIHSQVKTVFGLHVKTPNIGTVIPPMELDFGLIRSEEIVMRGSNSFNSSTVVTGRFWPTEVTRNVTASCSDVIVAPGTNKPCCNFTK